MAGSTRKSTPVICQSRNVSCSGILLKYPPDRALPEPGELQKLSFVIPSGLMPEGYESRVSIDGRVARVCQEDGSPLIAVQFSKNLKEYMESRRWRRGLLFSLVLLGLSLLTVLYVRRTCIFYFLFNVPVFFYSLVASTFLLSRYAFSLFYRTVPVNPEFTPGVSIIIPCYNEEKWIHKTIMSCLNQDYPENKLEVILVDDGSTDDSLVQARRVERRVRKELPNARFTIFEQPGNLGKRHALARGTLAARYDFVVFVDSDSFLDHKAIRHLMQPFADPKMGAVTGRTEVYNKWTNYLTKMQSVRYFVSFRVFKAAEAVFDAVTCLSGPLACYRKSLVLEELDAWCNQTFLGQPATFGDDRSLTNFILARARTGYQDTAVCHTIVPSSMRVFLKQQMRWKRSWLRESIRAGSFFWRKEPFMALSFYIGLLLPLLAPVVVLNALVYQPCVNGAPPWVYLTGIFAMSMLMSASYLFFKKSRIWVYGIMFCLFYLIVLMWQMLWAIVTFSTPKWGTRATAVDMASKGSRPEAASAPGF